MIWVGRIYLRRSPHGWCIGCRNPRTWDCREVRLTGHRPWEGA